MIDGRADWAKTTVMLRNFFGQLFAVGNGSGQRRAVLANLKRCQLSSLP
jgi:hypothetical protein